MGVRKTWCVAFLSIVLAGGLMMAEGQAVAASNTQVEVLLDARKLSFPDAKPFQDQQGSVMVPIRFVSEALGAKISWSKARGVTKVDLKKGDNLVSMIVGQDTALINGKSKSYGTKIIIKQNRTFVPLRLVSEGLGEKVQWDKVGRWVWIGERGFRNTDDKEFKLQSLKDFKQYTKADKFFTKFNGESYDGIKIISFKDLPIKLGNGEVIYDIKIEKSFKKDYIAIRSSQRGTPIFFMLKDDFVKYRYGVDNAFINHKDGTATNFYPIVSTSDKFQNGVYVKDYVWTDFNFQLVDYIAFSTDKPENYIVALSNPF
ncbi:stalk domain-containing protein [Paenibacillus lemnae]|uniref:Copper amine oxidase N-terminal domain-containing protein n=1 Tax=Paenibacillus lemnae TaxID=1330551 RepID=A0A848M4G5_PAELE|nr:stalk domain-containing protein [Paenibacillus lemnae]NMO95675.1 copper amine oxidase N-terminal domain-containing protein [Paenibacillus lemnae]